MANADIFFDNIQLFSASRTTISAELFERLRTAILTGSLPPGYVFPNENDLCQKLNIGRTSLREAYSSLETLNLITRRKTGTVVNAPQETNTFLNFEEIARSIDTATLMEYRSVTEVAIIQNAATKVTQSDIQKLKDIISRMEEVQDDATTLSQYDFDFHASIAAITKNKLLIITFNTIRAIYEDFTEKMFDCGAYAQSFEDHKNIIRALEAHNPVLSGEMMYRHISNVQGLLKSLHESEAAAKED